MFKKPTILVIDDDPCIVSFVSELLATDHYTVLTAQSAEDALPLAIRQKPDLIICDINLPGIDGMELCKIVKKRYPDVPLIFLSGLDDELDKVLGLELGAEDYITKPFQPREFKARIKVVLRRQRNLPTRSDSILIYPGLTIDVTGRVVTVREEEVELTKKEFDILVLLASRPGQVFTRETILETIWKDNQDISDRTVDVHIGRLRDKIEENLDYPCYIETVRGVGYRFCTQNAK